MRKFINFFVERSIVVDFCVIVVILVGIVAMTKTKREAFPRIEFDTVVITTIWEGASALDVEKYITKLIEDQIKEIDGLKEYRSISIENTSSITILIEPDAQNKRKIIDDIRNAVQKTQDLPVLREPPLVTEISSANFPVIEWDLLRTRDPKTGAYTISYKKLRDYAETLENKLLLLPGVAKVQRRGWQAAEIFVDMDPQKLSKFQVGNNDIVKALRLRNVSIPGGTIKTNKEEIVVRTDEEFKNIEEIKETLVRANEVGAGVRIKDVADVYEDFKEASIIQSTNNTQSIGLTIIKKESADILSLINSTKVLIEEFKKTLPKEIAIEGVNDTSVIVENRLNIVVDNGISGFFLVLLVLLLFLDWRTSLIVSLSIPFAFGLVFLFMPYFGVSLNMISMFALIMVMGMITDGAIVVSENYYRHIELGKDPKEAVQIGASEVFKPTFVTVLTSIISFATLLLVSGILGKFIVGISIVCIICLVAAQLHCYLVVPSNLTIYTSTSSSEISKEEKSSKYYHLFKVKIYEPFIRYGLDHKARFLLFLFGLIILSIFVLIKFGRFKLFSSAVDAVFIKFEMPIGVRKEVLQEYLEVYGKTIEKLPKSDLKNFITKSGFQGKDPGDPAQKNGGNYGTIVIYLWPENTRKFKLDELITWLREQNDWLINPNYKKEIIENFDLTKVYKEIGDFRKVQELAHPEMKGQLLHADIEKIQGGPPVGKPVAIEIQGDNLEILQEISEKYKKILNQIKGVEDIDTDFQLGKDEVRVKINEKVAAQANVSALDIGTAVLTSFLGSTPSKIRRPSEQIDIRVRYAEKYRSSKENLKLLSLTNLQGNLIPINRIATFKTASNVKVINHLNGRRLMTVFSNINDKLTTSPTVLREVSKMSKDIPSKYPDYSINFGGEAKDTKEVIISFRNGFLIGLFLIFNILFFQFRSFLRPLIILLAIPFGAIGVIFAFFFHSLAFGFTGLMGLVGLSGSVVNDSIILVDFADYLKKQYPNLSNKEIALQAGSTRLRASFLTSCTTIIGLLPTAYGLGGYDVFLVPLALTFLGV